MHTVARHSVAAGVAYIRRAQLAGGSYVSYSSRTRQPFVPEVTYATSFVPALILNALSGIGSIDALAVRTQLAQWLLRQKSPLWSFNYWSRQSAEYRTLPYPDDLDDTFCALIALYRHDPALINPACLAGVAKLLIATETQPGGPYRTWLVDRNALPVWQDTDVAVNSNVAYFVRLTAGVLPNLTAMIRRAIEQGRLRSPYYPSEFPLMYYAARALEPERTDGAETREGPAETGLDPQPPHAQFIQHILSLRDKSGHWGTPLQTALAISSLLYQASVPEPPTLAALIPERALLPAITYLVDAQQADGSWPAEAFCLDPAREGRAYYHGAAALTTALVVEALQLWAQSCALSAASPLHASAPTAQKQSPELHTRIVALATEQLAAVDKPLGTPSLQLLEMLAAKDAAHELTLLPAWFAQSLTTATPQPDTATLQQLGLANLYGWMAYTVYDDFLDGAGQPWLLPSANLALRSALAAFGRALPDDARFAELVQNTFTSIDAANAWETARCRGTVANGVLQFTRIPRYGGRTRLAERSLGHALGPLGVLAAIGLSLSSPAAHAVLSFCRHYLIARQLNDDLHDWQTDIAAGHLSYVVAALLRDRRIKPGRHPLNTLTPSLQQQLWTRSLPHICHTARQHLHIAQQSLTASKLCQTDSPMTSLLTRLDSSFRHTLAEQAKAQEFLQAYGN